MRLCFLFDVGYMSCEGFYLDYCTPMGKMYSLSHAAVQGIPVHGGPIFFVARCAGIETLVKLRFPPVPMRNDR